MEKYYVRNIIIIIIIIYHTKQLVGTWGEDG